MASPSPSSSRRAARGAAKPSSEECEPPQRFQLTEEEKAVLIECRRGSIARGLPLGVGSAAILRWLIVQDRVPRHMKRWSWFYYGVVFSISFFTGIRSYQQTCFKKIMALENSVLADQIRKYEAKMKGYGASWEECSDKSKPKARHHHRHQHTAPTLTPSQSQSEASAGSQSQVSDGAESLQPDAFSSPPAQSTTARPYQDDNSRATQSRTFDEIREENRRKQLQQNYPRPTSSSSSSSQDHRGGGGGPRGASIEARGQEERPWQQTQQQQPPARQSGAPVRRNKYGDEVHED